MLSLQSEEITINGISIHDTPWQPLHADAMRYRTPGRTLNTKTMRFWEDALQSVVSMDPVMLATELKHQASELISPSFSCLICARDRDLFQLVLSIVLIYA